MHGALLWLTPLLLSLSVLSEQVPPDPDEPFFILSLTEIPVCSSGEVVGGASEPLPYLPVTDASMRQQRLVPAFYQLVMPTPSRRVSGFVWCQILQLSSPLSSVPGESLAAVEDGPLSNVAMPAPMEESGETGLVNVKDIGPVPPACIVSDAARNYL